MSKEFAIGQSWFYPTLEGFENSRIIIGALEPVENHEGIVCVSIIHAPVPRENGEFLKATIPFMAFSKTALEQSVTELDAQQMNLPDDFAPAYDAWQNDPEGKGFLQAPFPVLIAQLSSDLKSDH